MVVQEIAGTSELVGSDVIVVHRLLKNTIDSAAYAFISDACVAVAGLDPAALGMERHTEAYDHIGEIGGWVHRLEPAWEEYRVRQQVYIGEDEAMLSYSTFVAAPAEVVWEFISSPTRRAEWGAGLDRIDQLDPSGRRRPGTLNHCVHGAGMILQEFIDWRPPRYFTSRATVPGGLVVISTHEVEPVEGGAIVHDRFQRPDDEAMAPMMEGLRQMLDHGHEIEAEALRAAVAQALAATATIAEPALPGFDEGRRLAERGPRSLTAVGRVLLDDVVDAAVRPQHALLDPQSPGALAAELGEVVTHQHQRPGIGEQALHPLHRTSLERPIAHRQSLIDQQYVRVHGGGDGELQPGPHPRRVGAERSVERLAQLGELDDLVDVGIDLGGGHPQGETAQPDVPHPGGGSQQRLADPEQLGLFGNQYLPGGDRQPAGDGGEQVDFPIRWTR